ncbi:MAG: cbb3-type cytochrome c oxidase subunit I, partial [Planctomycetota bacterium]
MNDTNGSARDEQETPVVPGHRRLWLLLGGSVLIAFLILGFYGGEVYRQAPPIPERVLTEDGRTLFTGETILDGQEVWQSIGGQQVGSIWGHGAYLGPDWSADQLHREALTLRAIWAQREHGRPYTELPLETRAGLDARLRAAFRTNTWDAASDSITVSSDRAAAMVQVAAHYDGLFADAAEQRQLREDYALHRNAVAEPERRADLAAFFWWTAWACATERPGSTVTYTNNWPHEPLVGNVPTTANMLWTILSVVLLLAGIGALVYWRAFRERHEDPPAPPERDPLDRARITPSMKAAGWYALVATGLFVLQVVLGAVTAHYTVEGQSFFGFPLADWLPYAVTRTWHVQLGIFWIATAFLAFGLFLAPAVGGREPRFQRLGVHVLLGALFLVVIGSLVGEWMAIKRHLPGAMSFWFGHQGYEYVDLGRAWQIALFGGILLWLVLMLRGLMPALRRREDSRAIVGLFTASAVAIGLFYGAG